jgi:SPP1 gp7 family putative phage head morphogenesis protein
MKKINSQVLQGIIQGESIPKIAKRIGNVQEMNKDAAIRSARTIVTGAENKGRMDSYKRAEADGIILQKEWIATNDNRTRHAHSYLDGVVIDCDKPFETVLWLSKNKRMPDKIMFPGDPSAHPANVYNCRCSMASVVKGFKKVR